MEEISLEPWEQEALDAAWAKGFGRKKAPVPVPPPSLQESFTGVDSHGHHWQQGKQVKAPHEASTTPAAAPAQSDSARFGLAHDYTGAHKHASGTTLYFHAGGELNERDWKRRSAAPLAAPKEGTNAAAPSREQLPPEVVAHAANLGFATRLAINHYQGNGYRNINRALRAGLPPFTAPLTYFLTRRAIRSAPVLDKPLTTYRGVDLAPAAADKLFAQATAMAGQEGASGEMTLKGFQSTSLVPSVATNFASAEGTGKGPIVFQMRVRQGLYVPGTEAVPTEAASGFASGPTKGEEQEFLLDHNTRVRVVSTKTMELSHGFRTKSFRVIEVEQIVDGRHAMSAESGKDKTGKVQESLHSETGEAGDPSRFAMEEGDIVIGEQAPDESERFFEALAGASDDADRERIAREWEQRQAGPA